MGLSAGTLTVVHDTPVVPKPWPQKRAR